MKQNHNKIKQIVESWETDEAIYKELEDLIAKFIESEIYSLEVYPSIFHRVKPLVSIIKTSLKKNKEYLNINDKLGFRIVVHFKSELDKINTFIKSSFRVKHYERKADKLKFDRLGYLSDHFEVTIDKNNSYFKSHECFTEIIFEIQVRTLCQHAWADVEHALIYKQDMSLDENQKRRIFRLTSLFEICDDEFDSLNSFLISLPEYRIFSLLKTLEGKFFKYAKRDYDKEFSLYILTILKDVFVSDKEIIETIHELDNFFKVNHDRIVNIFYERENQLNINPFLSQPEIFLIWFLIDERQYDLIRIWKDSFDIEDLYDISIWWGNPINI